MALTVAGRVAERIAREREQQQRQAQASSEQEARELQGRLVTQLPLAKVADWLHTPDAAPGLTQDPGAAAAPALDPEIEQARAVARANQARPPSEAATPMPSPLPGRAAQAHGSLPGPQSRAGTWER